MCLGSWQPVDFNTLPFAQALQKKKKGGGSEYKVCVSTSRTGAFFFVCFVLFVIFQSVSYAEYDEKAKLSLKHLLNIYL